MTEHYSHTQIGRLPIILLGLLLAITGAVMIASLEPVAAGIFVFIALVAANFATLTVLVDGGGVHLRFGIGLIRKSFPAHRIRSVEAAKVSLIYGWGIRLMPGGWLFRISGLEVVAIEMDNGRKYRVGTDEPEALVRAIELAREMARQAGS